MESPMKRLTLEIDSLLGEVSLVAVAIHALCVHAGMDQDEASQVELSLVEAVTNSIQHAYAGEPDHKVMVSISFDKEQLRFDLFDSGISMPQEQVDRLTRGDGIAANENCDLVLIPEGGRGLEIMYKAMDDIAYKREGGQNHLTLTRNLRAVSIRPADYPAN
jgi:serine/threonine-protein kinase RsbW